MNVEKAIALALEMGFTNAAALDVSTLKVMPEVRDMCAKGCRKHGKSWSCPPGCGSLEQCTQRIQKYRRGILVQTVGQLEDEFDGEGMIQVQSEHKERFFALVQALRKELPELLPLGSGGCDLCKTCTYPDSPCRFPEKMLSSMESYGLLVLQVCKDNGFGYHYGKDHIAYTACILLD